MEILSTIRRFKTKRFTVVVEAMSECDPVDVDDDGETARAVDRGELQHFCARARVLLDDNYEIGSEYLGSCIYKEFADFMDHRECGVHNRFLASKNQDARCGSYFSQMIADAIKEAREFLEIHKAPVMRPTLKA